MSDPTTIDRHVLPGFGLPYAASDIDPDDGRYFVRCPVCGETCFAPDDARTEDDITKGATTAYAEHFDLFARADTMAVAILDRIGSDR